MNSKKRNLWVNALIIFPLLLTACGPTSTPEPTVDVNALYTQAAVTIFAQLTANAPTIAPTTAATNTAMPSMTPLGGALPTLPPLATLPSFSTPTTAASNAPDKAAYVTQSPSDYSNVTTGKVFNIIWRLRNVGTTTWNTNYVYRFYSASNKISTAANGYNLPASVPPNGEVELKAVATASGTPGTYDTRWVITNADGVNFGSFDLTLNVVQGTGSNVVSETATGAPDACNALSYAGGDQGLNSVSEPTRTFDLSGGEVKIVYTVKGTTAATNLRFTWTNQEAGAGVDDQVEDWSPTKNGTMIIGDPDKQMHRLVVTMTGPGDVILKTIVAVSSNENCF